MPYEIVDVPASGSTYTAGRGGKAVSWLVVHYTGGDGSARQNGAYFAGGDRSASAHYFVDSAEVVRSVPEGSTAWHAGNFDFNQRSVGIEVCSAGEDFTEAEIARLAWLVGDLMGRYGVDAAHVIRHYDVVDHATVGSTVDPHKRCPAPYVDAAKWAALHARITGGAAAYYDEEESMQCIIKPNGEERLVWFDGTALHPLDDIDELGAVQKLANAVLGHELPTVELGEAGAPWYTRFADACRHTADAEGSFHK